ncbi:hypothetical protein CU097_008901 [Rhizopus azygosporus]|uniref:Uncharacterized protein n=1 Tax=Rhizopus azygosporus TaxID=86630 RepID=A0A367JAF0_RHIAZ|nr:hypothetical protein CU097_008901 [Rhizopus azygosporus]
MDTLKTVKGGRKVQKVYVEDYIEKINNNIDALSDEVSYAITEKNKGFLRIMFKDKKFKLSNYIIENEEIVRIIGLTINEEGLIWWDWDTVCRKNGKIVTKNDVNLSGPARRFDTQFHDVQYCLSGLTRPIDCQWDLDTTRQRSLEFAKTIHELLSDLASYIAKQSSELSLGPQRYGGPHQLAQAVQASTGRRSRPRPIRVISTQSSSAAAFNISFDSMTSSGKTTPSNTTTDNTFIVHSKSVQQQRGFQSRPIINKRK